MYAYLKGTLTELTTSYAVLETKQIGFQVALSNYTSSRLPAIGEEVKLFTAFVIRENSQALYGFLTSAEKHLFETLLDVSGIGPKIALSLCGHLPPEELLGAIARNDIPLLTKVPGIGKKTAERLVLDLRDRTAALLTHSPLNYQIALTQDPKTSDALSALVNLGYSQTAAQNALSKTLKESPEPLSLSALITTALKYV